MFNIILDAYGSPSYGMAETMEQALELVKKLEGENPEDLFVIIRE